MFHDPADQNLFAIADCINIQLDRILEIGIDEHRVALTRTASFM